MEIRRFHTLKNNQWIARVAVTNLTATEQELIKQFGTPIIETGGSFAGSITRPGDSGPTVVEFDLPTEQRRLPDDFPVQRIFDVNDDPDSDVKARVFTDTIFQRLAVAKTDLFDKMPDSGLAGEITDTI